MRLTAAYSDVLMQDSAVATANGVSLLPMTDGDGALSYATLQITGITSATITFEATIDGTNWVAIKFTNLTSSTAATTATADGLYQSSLPVLGLAQVRARISTYATGTIIINGRVAG